MECRAHNAAEQRKWAAAYRTKHGHSMYAKHRKPTTARHGNAVPRALRFEVYERDNWICQLCGEPVDRDLDPNHRMAATLDHVECQTWALIPDHSLANLRLAHRACNSRRRDRAA
jgi:5-methylcytosine-specific restriction endonuclease McrA